MTADNALQKNITVRVLQTMKENNEKFATVALYDAQMASIAEKSGVEVILVGDSLGMTILGYDSTVPVTIDNMIYHVEAVTRGNHKSLIIGDMPFMSYTSEQQTLEHAASLMRAGAHMVKLEGGSWLCNSIRKLSEIGVPVCGHLGLTPQSVNKLGGYRVQGRTESQAQHILSDAIELEKAGADAIVLECVPASLAQAITQTLKIPIIGIGAGKDTDAQVLVINDLLGMTSSPPKFAKNFLAETPSIACAIEKFVRDVKENTFPEESHIFSE